MKRATPWHEWQKGHTVIRVDEIESTGSMRLRLRSMVEFMRWKRRPMAEHWRQTNGSGRS